MTPQYNLYTMDHSKFIKSNQKGESISALWVNILYFQAFYSKKFSLDEERVSRLFEHASSQGIVVEQR